MNDTFPLRSFSRDSATDRKVESDEEEGARLERNPLLRHSSRKVSESPILSLIELLSNPRAPTPSNNLDTRAQSGKKKTTTTKRERESTVFLINISPIS